MASSSHKRKGKAPVDSTHVFRDETHENKFNSLALRKCLPGKNVDLNFLRKYFNGLYEDLMFQGLKTFLQMKNNFYSNLMKIFYSGMSKEAYGTDIITFIQGKNIRISWDHLGSLLDLPIDGEDAVDNGYQSSVDGYNRWEALSQMCSKPVVIEAGRIKSSELKLEMRILHLIIVHSLYPRSGSFTEVGAYELLLMWMISSRRKIRFPTIILRKMSSTLESGKGSLFYGMIITKILLHNNITLDEGNAAKLTPTDTLDERTLARMGYHQVRSNWVLKQTASSSTGAEEVEIPVPMEFDHGASTSASHATLEDILEEVRATKASVFEVKYQMGAFDGRMCSIEDQMRDFRLEMREKVTGIQTELEEIKKRLYSDSESDEC